MTGSSALGFGLWALGFGKNVYQSLEPKAESRS
jgi:hypothetical protein